MKRKLGLAVLIAAAMLVVVVGAVLATVITVDGNIADWPAGAFVTADPQEPLIPDQWNISSLWFTNDTTHGYFRWDTYTNTAYFGTFQLLCMDIDPNAVPVTGGTITQCAGQAGVDYIIRITDGGTGSGGTQQLLHCPDTATQWQNCTIVPGAGLQFAYSGVHTELGVNLADIGYTTLPLGSGNCPNSTSGQPCPMHVALYFDNGDVPPDDNVPDSGDLTILVGCAPGGTPCSPTAVTLESLSASTPQTETAMLILITAGVTALGVIGGLVVRRKRHAA